MRIRIHITTNLLIWHFNHSWLGYLPVNWYKYHRVVCHCKYPCRGLCKISKWLVNCRKVISKPLSDSPSEAVNHCDLVMSLLMKCFWRNSLWNSFMKSSKIHFSRGIHSINSKMRIEDKTFAIQFSKHKTRKRFEVEPLLSPHSSRQKFCYT